MWKSKLHETVSTTPTDFWNDSCAQDELAWAIEHGATGATSNPTIVGEVLAGEMGVWQDFIRGLIRDHPTAGESAICWLLIEEMARRAAARLLPVFEREAGRKGRLSVQTNPELWRDAAALVDHAVHLAGLAPNIQVKVPVTSAGLTAIEEATRRGVSINATVCFTVPQALAVAEAVERGLAGRAAAGQDATTMTPVCTIMVGRLDDWLRVIMNRDGVVITPGHLDWAGIACLKRAATLYRERGYRTRLLAAAYRHHLHWSELIGGDLILTIPAVWQRRFNASQVEVRPRFAEPVDPAIVASLRALFPDFCRAWEPDGLRPEDFDTFGATVRTLRTFIQSYRDLQATVRDLMLPNPDRKPSS
jgi:transaldolase